MVEDFMLPIIRQMLDAESDRRRAQILLIVPDAVLMKYRPVFEGACRRARFDVGLSFIDWRRAGWHAVRDANGLVDDERFDRARAEFAAFANVPGDARKPDRASEPMRGPAGDAVSEASETRREAKDA